MINTSWVHRGNITLTTLLGVSIAQVLFIYAITTQKRDQGGAAKILRNLSSVAFKKKQIPL